MLAVTALLLFRAGDARGQQASAEAPALARIVSIQLDGVTLAEALARLRHDIGIPLAYSGDVIPAHIRVRVALRNVTVRAVLDAVLDGSDLTVVITDRGTIVVVPRLAGPTVPAQSARRDVDLARGLAATGVRQLDEIVVMGSAVASLPEREQAVAVSVAPVERLAEVQVANLGTLIRRIVPGLVMWDRGPLGAPAQLAAVRGSSSFATRSLKTYVDGVELASPELFTLLDARAVERIEAIRGPQGAALYGPDALNGILQLESRKGAIGVQPVRARADAGAGASTRADAAGAEAIRDVGAGITGGGDRSSFDVGGRFLQVGNDAAARWRQSWSAQSGGRLLAGALVITGSARAGHYEYSAERTFSARAISPDTAPLAVDERAAGVTLQHSIGDHWRQSLVVGHDWISGDREPLRSALVPPDLPLGASQETASRTSARYSGSYDFQLGAAQLLMSGGVEYTDRHVARAERTALGNELSPLYDDELHSTGAFAQVRARPNGHLTISAGIRDEWISSVGTDFGPVWAATAGASWSQSIGTSTLRFRGAWGRGIRPPEPGMSRAMVSGTIQQEANSELAPEAQRGFEGGVELYAANGASARLTWYDQRATDLIQQVDLRRPSEFRRVYQFQNVGAITNRGVEVEGRIRRGRVVFEAFAAFGASTVRQLSARYTGELKVGDPLVEVPTSSGAASVQYDGRRLRLEAGLTWLGSWTGYDWVLIARVDRGEANPRAAARDYWREYPASARPYIDASFRFAKGISAFLRADNPGNAAIVVRDNLGPTLGRTIMLGVVARPGDGQRAP